MTERFVAVATYLSELDAELGQAVLAAAGIESFLKFEDTGGMMPVLQQSEGVKLLVEQKDEIEAIAILRSETSKEDLEAGFTEE